MSLFGDKKTKTEEKKPAAAMKDLYDNADSSAKSGSAGKSKKTAKNDIASRLLIKPLVTEKATQLASANKYVFVVDNEANKIEVAKAVQAIYGIKPLKVNLVNVSGKRVSRGRISGQRKDWRKAIITLPKGETIKIYEGV